MILNLLKFIMILSVMFFITGCGVEQKSPLRVGINLWPGYEPFFLARDMGEYANSPISLIEYPSPSGAIRAIRNGTVEAVALTLDEVFNLVDSGVKAKVVLITDISNGGDAILARPGINALEELRGKVVLSEATVLSSYMLNRAFDDTDLSLSDIHRVYSPISEHTWVYENSKVDAIVTFEPVRTKLIEAGAKELFSSADIPGEIIDVLIVRDDVIESSPEVVQALVDGWYTALQQLHAYPEKSSKMLSTRLHITPKEVLSSLNRLSWPNRYQVNEMLNDKTATLSPISKRIQMMLIQQQLLNHEQSFQSLFTDQFVK